MAVFKNLQLLKMFKEIEIACFNEEFIEAFTQLLDDKLSLRVKQFIDSVLESDLVNNRHVELVDLIVTNVEMMRDIMGQTIATNTFHTEAHDRGVVKTLTSLNIVTIQMNTSIDREELLTDVTWLLDNQDLWQGEIKPRSKEAFEVFMYEVDQLKTRALSMYIMLKNSTDMDFEYNPLLKEAIKENKAIFYQRENARNTGMYYIIRERPEIEKLHHWLEYNKLCDDRRVSTPLRYLIGGSRR